MSLFYDTTHARLRALTRPDKGEEATSLDMVQLSQAAQVSKKFLPLLSYVTEMKAFEKAWKGPHGQLEEAGKIRISFIYLQSIERVIGANSKVECNLGKQTKPFLVGPFSGLHWQISFVQGSFQS